MANGNGRRTTDASRLSFSLQLLILIASTCATAAGTIQWNQSGLREQLIRQGSDVRDINTRLELAATLETAQSKIQEERAAALKAALEAVQRDQRMTQFEVQSLKESLLKLQNGIDANHRSR